MANPGKELSTALEQAQMSRKELAQRTGVTEKHISTVISNNHGISASFARKLGYVFEERTADYWMRIQAEYDAEQERIKEANEIDAGEIAILHPLHEIILYFIECGYMRDNGGEVASVLQLRSLLNVSNLKLIPNITYNAAYRAQLTSNIRVDPYVLFAWQRLCEKQTEDIDVAAQLDIEMLCRSVPEIKRLMTEEYRLAIQKLQKIMARCGVAFQVVRNFRGAPVQGFIRQMPGNRLILCLTNRGRRADTFWFTLFHEIAHILNEDYSTRFVDFDSVEGDKESRANAYARDTLIDPQLYAEFVRESDYLSWAVIRAFACKVGVPDFIVLGRLQNDKILDWSQFSDNVVYYG